MVDLFNEKELHCICLVIFLTFALCSLLSPQEQRLRYLKQQEQRQQQQATEQEKLQRLRENIENQESRLKKVRALKGQVEQKRLSNGKLGKLMDAFNSWVEGCTEYFDCKQKSCFSTLSCFFLLLPLWSFS